MGDLLLDEDWDLADNTVVSQAMRLLSAWQAQMNLTERKYRELENDVCNSTFLHQRMKLLMQNTAGFVPSLSQ